MSAQSLLIDHLATRARSLDFAALGLLLPNPDPILKAQGKDITTYRDMRTDPLIGGNIRRRKSAVKAMMWGLDRGQAPARVAKSIESMLGDLDLERIIGQMLEATLYGYQPLEVMWSNKSGLWAPADVVAKPPEWFCFDAENRLRFKTVDQPMYGELLPERKFLLPRQDPTYQNPYGFPDLSMCFWPLVFKKGGLKFWLAFTEKFGSAFSVGKLPRGASAKERAELLDSLDSLIQNGVATIPDDGSVELLEMAGKSASAELYERLVMHCGREINIALLGQNQTTEATANKASAGAGLEVTEDLRDGDAEIVAAAVNQLIRWIGELNFASSALPTWSLWDQDAKDQVQSSRDKSNYEAGARFSNAYFQRTYGYEEGDLVAPAAPALPATPAFAEPTLPADGVDAIVDEALADWEPVLAPMVDPIQEAFNESVANGETAAELLTRLPAVLERMDPNALARALTSAAFAARLGAQAGLTDV